MKNHSRKCTHLWKIEKCSRTLPEQGGKLRSEKFSATDDDFYWCLEYTRCVKNTDQDFISFNLRPDFYGDLRKYESVSGDVNISLTKPHLFIGTGGKLTSFNLRYDKENRNFKWGEYKMDIIEKYVLDDTLTIKCTITYRKNNETVPICSLNYSNTVRISECRLSSDMERCFTEDRFKDVTISVKGKEYRAHKTILAARSTMFEKMLTADMLESKKNQIDITDIDHEPFEKMLYYIYTGKVKNLNESAFELLPLADKYDLKELWNVCEEVLVKKLTTDNAVKILILADTHRAEELKEHTLRLIKENYVSFEDFDDTEFWKNLAASNAQLLKEMMAAFCKRQKLD